MLAVRYDAPRSFSLATVADPVPGPGDVRVAVTIAGCCGTDLHIHAGGFLTRYPLIPGHEIVGEVESVGADVETLRPGMPVAVDNTVLCGRCVPCRRDEPRFCRNFHSLGVTDDGGFAEFVVARAEKCFPVAGLRPEQAVMVEPLACVVHGLDVLGLRAGSDVLVLGAGPTGLLLAQLLGAAGAARVTVAAPTKHKLELAASFGADETRQIVRGDVAGSTATLRRVAPEGFDVVVEATGSPELLAACPDLTGDGGTVLVYGMADEGATVAFRPYELFRRELTVKGSFAQTHCFDRSVAYLRSGRVATAGILTHRYPLAGYAAALGAMADDPACVKAAIVP